MLPHILAVFACKRTSSSRPSAQTATALFVGLISIAAGDVSGQQPAQPPRPTRPSPPPPDIYLASLTVERGSVSVGTPLNITDRVGYDNQPSFTSDGRGVFFTSVREDAQADIYRYDVRTKATTRVTSTAPESEYSATPVDSDRAISVVRVERDSTQRLWRFPLDGSAPSVILERVRPVGYHAWANEHTLALFVLGSPNTLQLADTRSGSADTLATGIGRSLHRIPADDRVSFVRKVSPTEWWIEALDPRTRTFTKLVRLPEGVEDYAWLADGSIICGRDSQLLQWSKQRGDTWRSAADFSTAGVKGITRLAVSRRGDRVAFVAEGRAEAR